jgi:CheY-like chemotaxis protein/signal transduction histidine kinase/HAMP domain-containing protein
MTPPSMDFPDPGELLRVLTAFRRGDFSARMAIEYTGVAGKIADTVNEVIDLEQRIYLEEERVGDAVGKEGKVSQRAVVEGAVGGWAASVGAFNNMIGDLVRPTSETARVLGAVAKGDLTQTMALEVEGRPLEGEFLHLAAVVNGMVRQLATFTAEVTRIAREVGIEGKLGGQADIAGAAGSWKNLADSVNLMAFNLTSQVRNIAAVTTAIAGGDFSKKITVDVRGEVLQLKDTMNTMVDQLRAFSLEVARVAHEIGTEGKLGTQAAVPGVGGTWNDLIDGVNSMASNLAVQVRSVAEVATAVARGDLSRKITIGAKGEVLELKDTINTMVDRLSDFSSKVTRVAREVGTQGKLGGQAMVPGAGGAWKEVTDSVNTMASNLTAQVRSIANVTAAVASGDLSRKLTADVEGEILDLNETINTMVDQLNAFASEVTRVAREVGTEGKLGGQASIKGMAGTWKDLTDNVNLMGSNLTAQVRNIAEVTTAVANGDLRKKFTVDAMGEILQLKDTINTMVDQLNAFPSEVTRVAREVGTEGTLGGQAMVRGVSGTWKDLTDSVNFMAQNLTTQVRGIAKVVTAVANGDLKRKLTLDARGEIAELADTINSMNDTLAVFADQVTTVAREVGIDGKLGGQANVPGAAGIWRNLTDNVNQLAGNLTTQVRAIAEVSTAVTKGDLTRSIEVEAAGEVAALKDNINQMIKNLQDTTQRTKDLDWLKTNLAKLTGLLQGQREFLAVSKSILSELAPLVGAQHGAFYIAEAESTDEGQGKARVVAQRNGNGDVYKLLAGYAFKERKGVSNRFRAGEGLIGQCAVEKERILITDAPADYVHISSGLGEARPKNIVVQPVVFEGQVKAIVELASFNRFSEIELGLIEQFSESIGVVLNTISAGMRTEDLLKQSQALAGELQAQQEELTETNQRLESQAKTLTESETLLKSQREELQQKNEELEERSEVLGQQKKQVESKNREVELARALIQEKAQQLTLTSKYKSEFLANMSHELRTPLNSLLILSKMLAENVEGNLTPKQVEYAETVYASGGDLLALINDILDLSKVEAGSMAVDLGELRFDAVRDFCEQTFRPVAGQKKLELAIKVEEDLPASIRTDGRRLQQILKNLLSNAFKFTDKGGVHLTVRPAAGGWSADQPILDQAEKVVAFVVTDSGIGIARDKHHIVFEAFQQADGTTSRKYGGTGLGLSISREIAKMLGGEIRLESDPGNGSVFTLYLPITYVAPIKPPGDNADGGDRAGKDEAEPALGTPSPNGAQAIESTPAAVSERVAQAIDDSRESGVIDDRDAMQPGDRVLLIVEDDDAFAQILLDEARERGFKGLVAGRAETAFQLLGNFAVDAITLDLGLPDRDGWTVLDGLKHNGQTRHIPVHIISSAEGEEKRGLKMGALAYLHKPATREAIEEALGRIKSYIETPVKKLLVVEDNEAQRKSIAELIGNHDVETTSVGTGQEALDALGRQTFHCMVLDLMLPDMSGFQLIERIKEYPTLKDLPIIIYSGKELSKQEETELRRVAEAIVIKDVRSPERLLDETAIFLHRVEANLPKAKQRVLQQLRKVDETLTGRRVLIVDDDIRNIFALTSVFDRWGIQSVYAENGKDGIAMLKNNPEIEAVLMDVMMPEMDGYETMREIRKLAKFKKLPIIAVTAKAMKGDREKCIEAGASDYVAKPVDTDQLLSLLRVWLYR